MVEDISEFHEIFIKDYNEESDEGYFLEIDVQDPENLHNLHNDLPFFPERIKTEEIENLVANLHNKNSYANIYLHKKYKTGIKSWTSFKKSW